MAYMYILKCSDDSYYVGSTIDLQKRIAEHNMGVGAKYTKRRLPVRLVYCEEYENVKDAFLREKQVQGWSRKKREALINNDLASLPVFAKSKKNVVSTGSTTDDSGSTTYDSGKTTDGSNKKTDVSVMEC